MFSLCFLSLPFNFSFQSLSLVLFFLIFIFFLYLQPSCIVSLFSLIFSFSPYLYSIVILHHLGLELLFPFFRAFTSVWHPDDLPGGCEQGLTTSGLRGRLDLDLDLTRYRPNSTQPDLPPCRPRPIPTRPPLLINYLRVS